MSELDEFRPRIRNWSRVYRDRLTRHESNLMPILRALRMSARRKGEEVEASEACLEVTDPADAAKLDRVFLKLSKSEQQILKVAYLTRFVSETYENMRDLKKAESVRANALRMWPSEYRRKLCEAEASFMRLCPDTHPCQEPPVGV